MPRGVRAVFAALFAAVLLGVAWLGFFFYRDNFSGAYPNKFIGARALRELDLPLWNFHDSGGQPLGGNPNTLTFYPDTLLYFVLPPHVAFNLHFLIHLIGAFAAMRALCIARGTSPKAALFGATVYVLSGAVISSTAFYNLVVVTALLPLALLGVERRSLRLVSLACGLLGLAAEPVAVLATALAIAIAAWRRMTTQSLVYAAVLATLIATPLLFAYFEISAEVERAHGISAATVLRTSLTWRRVAEIFVWPLAGDGPQLFLSIFIGVIALPALRQRSRYVAIAVVSLLFAIGSSNPLLRVLVENVEAIRVARYPEKFVLPLTVALAVLIAAYFDATRFKRSWAVVTLAPLAFVAMRTMPIDWFAPYAGPHPALRAASYRVFVPQQPSRGDPPRVEYRARAERREPLFGATSGLRYAFVRSPDRMHSFLSRIAFERFVGAPPELKQRYLAVALGPPALIVPRALPAPTLQEAVRIFEMTSEHVAPRAFVSAPGRIRAYREEGQRIIIDVDAAGPVLLLVNQSYFEAWYVGGLETLPVDIDRLGVIVPGRATVTLSFGQRRNVIALTWILTLVLLALLPFVESLDRSAGEVERPADEH